jgi:hypothetical protein
VRNRIVFVWAAVCLGWLAGGPATADDPGKIVIRPKNSGVEPPSSTSPDDANGRFLVIRPQRGGDPPRTRTPILETPATPQRPPLETVPVPVPTPVPDAPDAKPAPEKEKETGKVLLETWDTAYLKGQKVGYFHVKVREVEKDGRTFIYATKEQHLTVARFGQVVEQWADDETLEQPDGTVLVVRMRQGLSKEQKLAITGQVSGRTLTVKGEGPAAQAQDVPWPDGVLGISKESALYRDKKPKPGESFDYLYYEGRLNRVVKITITAKSVESVSIIQGQPAKKLLRLEAAMEPIGNFRIPPSTVWCDAETFEPLRTDSDMPSLGGRLVVLRTSEKVARAPVGKVPDLFDVQSIRLAREVLGIHDKAGVVYKLRVESDPDFATLFPEDARQAVRNVDKDTKTLDLHVTAVRGPKRVEDPNAKPAKTDEFLSSNFFIDWNDDGVKRHAKAATERLPAGTSDWERAKAIEAWVHRNMRAVEFSQAMATAAETAKTLSGDCTEYAMLAAGMCRAVGIPSRTALGLVYAPGRDGRPFLAYHMWFEVFVDGQWLALDGTLGRGSVGPGHIKITDASWHNERSFAPLLPVLRVLMAQPKVDVGTVTDGR